MGLRFQRRVNLGPLRLNFSRSGVGLSAGVPGFRVGVRPNGRRYSRVSLPGTGVGYHTEYPTSPRGPSASPPAQGAGCAAVFAVTGAALSAIAFI